MKPQDDYLNNQCDSDPTVSDEAVGGQKENRKFLKKIFGHRVEKMKLELQRYKDYLCGEYRKTNTIRTAHHCAKKFLEYVDYNVNKDSIQNWRIDLNKKYKHNTINTKIIWVNKFLDFIGKPGLKQKIIGFKDIPKDTLSQDEIEHLIDISKEDPELHLIMRLCFDGILRPDEIIKIKISNRVRSSDGYDKLYLDDTKTGDNYLIMSKRLQEAWDEYIKIRPTLKPEYSDYLLICLYRSNKGNAFKTTEPIRRKLRNLTKNAEFDKHVTPYTIKNTILTLLQNQESSYFIGDIKKAARMARHKDIKTTLKYDCINDNHIKDYFKRHVDELKYKHPEPQYKQPEPAYNPCKPEYQEGL